MPASEFRTTDMALAATLALHGHPHDRLEILDRRKVVWVFAISSEQKAIVEDYELGCAEVEPRDFAKATRRVRDEMYAFIDAEAA